MSGSRFATFCIAAALIIACTTTPASQAPTPQPATQTSSTVQPGPGAPPAGQPGPGGPGGPGGQGRRPNPIQQDSLRRIQVDSIMRAIAGHESEPAGKVFKNVKLLKGVLARD